MNSKLLGFIVASVAAFAGLALLVSFWPQETQAQNYYQPGIIFLNATNSIAGATTNALSQVIDARGGKDLALSFTSQFVSAGVSNITVLLTKSVDKVNFEAISGLTMTWVGNGTNVVTTATNFTVNAIPYLGVTVVNASAANFNTTNSSLHFFIK